MTTNDPQPQEGIDVRRRLVAAGYAPHEAEAQVAFQQVHLSDYLRGGRS